MRELALAPFLVLVTGLGASSCVSFRWERASVNSPVGDEVLARLVPGTSTLSDGLAALGAPVLVWELPRGVALAWGWSYQRTRGIAVSVPIARAGSVSASYDDVARDLSGVVLFFDDTWTLRDVRRGHLAELRRSGRARPPAPPEATERESARDSELPPAR